MFERERKSKEILQLWENRLSSLDVYQNPESIKIALYLTTVALLRLREIRSEILNDAKDYDLLLKKAETIGIELGKTLLSGRVPATLLEVLDRQEAIKIQQSTKYNSLFVLERVPRLIQVLYLEPENLGQEIISRPRINHKDWQAEIQDGVHIVSPLSSGVIVGGVIVAWLNKHGIRATLEAVAVRTNLGFKGEEIERIFSSGKDSERLILKQTVIGRRSNFPVDETTILAIDDGLGRGITIRLVEAYIQGLYKDIYQTDIS